MNPFINILASLRPPSSLQFGVLSSFLGIKIFFCESTGDKDKKISEEEAESAKVLFRKPLGSLGLLGSV